MRRLRLASVLVSLAVLLLAGCPADPCSLEPAYGGDATDEVWSTLNDATNDAEEGGDAATLESPSDGDTLDAAGDAPTFSWSSPLKLAALGQDAGPRGAPADPRVFRPRRSVVDALSAVLIPRAMAHLPPVTSDAYLLNIEVPGKECPVQAVTTGLEATLDTAGWDLLKSVGGSVTARVVSAYLESGRITEGPFVSAPVALKVE